MIIGCALFMELLDSTAVLTALAEIAEDFGESSVHMNLIVSLYLLAVAMFIPISGWLAERYGPRRLFIVAIALFIISSLACALSTSLLQLSLARFCQGTAGAMMVPVGQIILLRWISKANLMRAMAFLTMPALLGPMVGPPLGGLLVTTLSWHWIFLINLPIGLLGIVLILRHIPDYPGQKRQPLDLAGFLLSSLALASLVLAFESLGHGRSLEWFWSCALLGNGLLFGLLYTRHARRSSAPLLDFSLLRIPTFGIVMWGGTLFRLGSASLPFLLVLLFQVGFGLSALEAGLLTFAGGAGALLIKFISVRLVRRFGFRRILLCNAVIGGLSVAICTLLQADTPALLVILMLFVGGLSRSLQMSTMGALTYADISSCRASKASTLSAMAVQLGMSLAVCIAALLLGLIQRVRGHEMPSIEDIGLTMALVSLLCLSSALLFRRLDRDSGMAVAKG
ncbi:MFS transporter [Phytopseudomonas daroniae]|uniref:MFS transporter n=1 Tax=Phytopseudomonas daroniae TaxID=2487519 RepID=UPI00103850CA|nr:MFS transporter [Pseudomonas daroniae]TBU73724.1 MFS transporter [Pseudomonas daroniae]